ncbi:MAG: sodium ion-translocating decarboxylase subunit beta [Dehalococcoidia bacterium]|nr:MAG: sodium ion-translocating decarboxylase subunit beta [Dehalococcoidia bacterium]
MDVGNLSDLAAGFKDLWADPQVILMVIIGGVLIYLGIAKGFEPLLLLPIGMGIVLVNLYPPLMEGAFEGRPEGILAWIYSYGIKNGIIPLLIFLGVGAMADFSPLLSRPIFFLFGAAAQIGVFIVFLIAIAVGFEIEEAACVGIIGGSDGPPTVYITAILAPQLLGPITLAAYAYMALVPIVQPPIVRLLTTKKERAIVMKPETREVSRRAMLVFPVLSFVIAAVLIPRSAPLVGMLMFGNLLNVSGVTHRLARSASTVFIDVLTFLLGLCVGALMSAEVFLRPQTLAILGLAALAFAMSTAGGVLMAKFVNLFRKEPINPVIGAAGVSAVPMAARVAQKLGQEANPENFLLMHAMGPNMAGVIATSVAAGIFLQMLS